MENSLNRLVISLSSFSVDLDCINVCRKVSGANSGINPFL